MDIAHHRDLPALGAATHLVGGWTRLIPLLCAIAGTLGVLFAADALLAPEHRVNTLLWQRGPTQPLTLALFFWGAGHLLRRAIVQAGEHRALAVCRQMLWHGPPDREELLGRLDALARLRDTLAGDVLYAVLSYFRAQHPTRDELLESARQAIDRAHDRVDAEWRPLTAAMWLLPLSGFLGTVVGMGAAIGSFDGVITAGGGDLQALVPAVAGLATAFDTTLLALALVVPLKLCEVALDGRDRRLVDRIDRDLGAGYVQRLDLAGLAQHGAAADALEQQAETIERIERSLAAIDRALAGVAGRLDGLPPLDEALTAIVALATTTRAALPRIEAELGALRAQGEAPIVIRRGESS